MSSEAAPTATFDASHIDYDALLSDLKDLRRELEASLGEEDVRHLFKIERIGRAATAFGVATSWMFPNPLTMASLALGRSTRWLLMHHIGHRGYDKVPGIPARYTSRVFARGSRRFLDWADWMIPEAWMYEHNVLHHSNTGEEKDPDLVERNTEWLRRAKVPMALKYLTVLGLAASWRFSYYAPNTIDEWLDRQAARDEHGAVTSRRSHRKELWLKCYLPYGTAHFVLFPLLFLPLGPIAALNALGNSLGGEALTNLHTFCVVGPNHTGDDVYRYDGRPTSRGEAMLRQVEKYGVPYPQAGVLSRVKKLVDVAVGKTSMKRVRSFVGGSTTACPHQDDAFA